LKIPVYTISSSVFLSLNSFAKLLEGSLPILVGCDVAEIEAMAKTNRHNCSSSRKKIIEMVARLDEIKDHYTLILAFKIIHEKYPETDLWIIGDGDKRKELEELTHGLKLKKSVVFWGNRKETPELLGKIDIFVFSTTENEGLGIALIEAMAARLPVVASDVSACKEVLDSGVAGVLAPKKNPEIFAKAIESLLLSEQERILWGERAFKRVSEKYDIKRCANQWSDILLKGSS